MEWKSKFQPASWLMAANDLHKVALLIAERIESDFRTLSQDNEKSCFSEEELPYFHLGGVFWINAGLWPAPCKLVHVQ